MTTPNIIRLGVPGTPGTNAYATTTAGFVQPAINATVSVTVSNTSWMALGQIVYIETGGYYSVSSLTSGTVAVLRNLGYQGNAAPSATVVSTSLVSPGGVQGAAGYSRTVTDATTARTLSVADAGAYIRMTSASPNVITVPANIFAQDDEVSVFQAGAGQTTFAAGVGVTINAAALAIAAQKKAATLKCVDAAANIFDLVGAL